MLGKGDITGDERDKCDDTWRSNRSIAIAVWKKRYKMNNFR